MKQLLEQEKRRKEEAAKKAKLMALGACPVGFHWINKVAGIDVLGGRIGCLTSMLGVSKLEPLIILLSSGSQALLPSLPDANCYRTVLCASGLRY